MNKPFPGVRPDEFAGESDSEAEVDGEPASPASVHVQDDLPEDATDQDLSEDANYRENIRGIRSFMGWHQIPDYNLSSFSLDDNPFAGSRTKPASKVSLRLPVDEWLCKKSERLNVTVAEGYSSRNSETGGLLRDQLVKTPRSSKWYAMHTDKKDSASATVCGWSLEPAKVNSTFTRVARSSLPSAPASRTFSQDTLRRWERPFQEQSVMFNQAAGLSRCLTKVQDSMVSQLKTLRVDTGKGKAAERTQQAVEELEYLVTFNRSISQAMQRTMQFLSEGVFISMANLTLARRDSYLEFLRGGVKSDTLTALRTAPVHLNSLFPVADQHNNRTGSPLHRPGSKLGTGKLDRKVVVKPQTSPNSRPRVSRSINDNYCVLNVAGVKNSVHVSGKKQVLNPSPVVKKSETVVLHVNSFAANVHSVTGLPQKKGVNPNYCCTHTEIKHVNNVSCVGHLSSVTLSQMSQLLSYIHL